MSMTDFDLEEYEKINPVATLEGVQFVVPNQFCLWRVNSLHTKEPDTVEWISTFNEGDVLIDIGANVGMYSIWAAAKQNVTVYAFEPESQNYALLCRNIAVNQLQDNVTAYCVAISDDTAENGGVFFDKLNLSEFKLGGSCHSFGEEVDYHLKPRPSAFRQGCLCISLDQFMTNADVSTSDANIHIKIDVDGIEHKVITSAMNTIQSEQVKSVLIELNTNLEIHNELIGLMEGLGYTTTIHDQAIRAEGSFKGIGNHIFVR
jgi:FkbM family methyltransferase